MEPWCPVSGGSNMHSDDVLPMCHTRHTCPTGPAAGPAAGPRKAAAAGSSLSRRAARRARAAGCSTAGGRRRSGRAATAGRSGARPWDRRAGVRGSRWAAGRRAGPGGPRPGRQSGPPTKSSTASSSRTSCRMSSRSTPSASPVVPFPDSALSCRARRWFPGKGRRARPRQALADALRATSARTIGATSVPKSSIERITSACGVGADAELDEEALVVEDLVLEEDLLDDLLRAADDVARRASVRLRFEVRRGSSAASRARGRSGPSPGVGRVGDRRPPACEVSATKPWELMPSGRRGRGRPRPRPRRWSSANGANRAGSPPMIASAIGRPSAPARTADCGVPPTATQTGSGSCSGRGYTPRRRSAGASRPVQRDLVAVAQPQQQLELLGEELVVVLEVVAEERERLDEGAAAGHDLGAAAGEQVERRELLEHADGIVGAEHGDGAGEADPLGALGRGGEHHGRGGDGEVGTVVLADPEDVEADLVGELDLLDQVAQALLGADDRPARPRGSPPRRCRRRVPRAAPVVVGSVHPARQGTRARSRRASSGAESSMTSSRSTWTASTNVVSAPPWLAVARTTYSPPGVVAR